LFLAERIPFRWAGRDAVDIARLAPFNCAIGDHIAPEDAAFLRRQGIEAISLKDANATILEDAKWPQIQTGANGDIASGPTGNPWIDANGYAIQAARAPTPDRPVWLLEDTPPRQFIGANQEQLAVCDAAAYGGHWLPSPVSTTWDTVVTAQRFFLDHRAWRSYQPVARVAVVSDLTAAHRVLALETLNLLARLNVPFTIARTPPSGAAMVLDIDKQPADMDAWELATETHAKLGRRNDVFRLWNGSSLIGYPCAPADGSSLLLQLINYSATLPGESITAGVPGPFRSARIFMLDRPAGASIELHRTRDSVEVYLPPFAVYAAIEFVR